MVKLENDCSCCERCGNCGLKKQPHLYCDSCGNETDTLFKLQGIEKEYICNARVCRRSAYYSFHNFIISINTHPNNRHKSFCEF